MTQQLRHHRPTSAHARSSGAGPAAGRRRLASYVAWVPAALTVVLAVLVLASAGLDTVLRVAGALALGVVALSAAAVGALAVVLRRRLRELRHLPDLGCGYVTHHDGGVVTAAGRDADGDLVLEVLSETQQTMVLDESGTPERVQPGAGARTGWTVRGSRGIGPVELDRITALHREQVPVQVVSRGVIGLAGPVATTWRLEAANGVVVESRA